MMKVNKKGSIGNGTVEKYITLFLLIVVLFKVVANLLPEAQTAGDELNASGAPLGALFVSSGVVWLIVMAGLVLLVVGSFMGNKK